MWLERVPGTPVAVCRVTVLLPYLRNSVPAQSPALIVTDSRKLWEISHDAPYSTWKSL
jgi:hypothetical protein